MRPACVAGDDFAATGTRGRYVRVDGGALPHYLRCGRVFLRVDGEAAEGRAVYLITHPCVVSIECRFCGAKPGRPCKGAGDVYVWRGDTHYVRRNDYAAARKALAGWSKSA